MTFPLLNVPTASDPAGPDRLYTNMEAVFAPLADLLGIGLPTLMLAVSIATIWLLCRGALDLWRQRAGGGR